MANVSLVQAVAKGAATGSPVSVSLGSLPSAGNLLILFFADGDAQTISSVKDNQPGNNYTQITPQEGIASSIRVDCYALVAPSSSGTYTVTVTFGGASDFGSLYLMEYSGLANPLATDGGNGQTVSSTAVTTQTTLNVTTTVADILIGGAANTGANSDASNPFSVAAHTGTSGTWGMLAGRGGASFSESAVAVVPSGLTTVGNSVAAVSAATYGADFTDSAGTVSWALGIWAFKASAAAGGPVIQMMTVADQSMVGSAM